MHSMPMHYSHTCIAASVSVSMVASYAAFCFAERLTLAEGARRVWWLAGGSLVMGFGIWSMHYLGMLAMSMPVDVAYSPGLVVVSLLLAVCASATALRLVSQQSVNSRQLALGAALMGVGIGAMHYTGMAAMLSSAKQHYSLPIVGLSILVAVGFSWGSLLITFRLRDYSAHSEALRISGAAVMGLGIAAMHYTAMGAVSFAPGPDSGMRQPAGIHVGVLGTLGVLLTTSLVLGGALLAAILDRVTYRQLREAHAELEAAHGRLVHAQQTLLASERALAEANRQLQELSIRDGLTRVYNRRYFDDAMEAEWRRVVREKAMVAMLMVDVDHFKQLNDTAGHTAGDEVLKGIAEALGRVVEETGGVLARYGGEEFAAIVPVKSAIESYLCAERMREAVATMRITVGNGLVPEVTASVGVAAATSHGFSSALAALQAADQALYRAKQLGRNRVEAAGELRELYTRRADGDRRAAPPSLSEA